MNAAQDIAQYLIQTIAGIYVFIALMRVLLQASRADYYNPISQFVVKATQAPVSLLSKAIPSWKRLDLAAIVWVLLVQVIATEAAAVAAYGTIVPIGTALAWAAIATLNFFLTIVFWGMVIIIVISFATLLGGMMIAHPALDLLRQLMTPIMTPVQRILPPMGGIDLSPIILFMLINVFKIITLSLARGVNLNPNLVVGF